MTKNLILAAVAGFVCLISTLINNVQGLGSASDLLECAAQAVWLIWMIHGIILIVRRVVHRDFA